MEWSWVVGVAGLATVLPYLSGMVPADLPCWVLVVTECILLALGWSGYILGLDPVLSWLQPIACCAATLLTLLLVGLLMEIVRSVDGDTGRHR